MVADPSRRPRRTDAVVFVWLFIDRDVGADVGQRLVQAADPPSSVFHRLVSGTSASVGPARSFELV